MSYIQLPYGYVRNNKQIQFNLPNNYEESFYFEKVPYLTNKNPAVENNLINLIKNRDDLKRWLLATSDYGREIQDNLNAVVGYNEKFNNSIVRHALDLKDESIFCNPNPINVTFYDMKKFDQVNPVIGKLTAQVNSSNLTEQEINQKLLDNFEADTIQAKLDKLKYGSPDDDDDDDGNKKRPGGTPGGTPVPPKTPLDYVDELQKRLDCLRGNDVSPHNTPEQNAKIIQRKNTEKFINQQLRQREKELSNLPKGNFSKKRSSIRSSLKFKLPGTPPATPFDDYWDDVADNSIKSTSASGPPEPPLFYYERGFPPLSRSVQKAHLPPITPKTSLPPPPSNTLRETSFLTPEGSVSPLRNKLPFIAPLPNINNFSRPITDIIDQKNNTISITPKKIPLPPIGQKQLPKQLHKIFPDVDDTIKERADTFKERNSDIDELVEKVGRTEESESTFEFEFFSGGENFKFNSFFKAFGLTTVFIDFLQSNFCKEILQTNALKIHIKTGNIYYNDTDTNESVFEFITNQQNTSKAIINNEFKFDGNYKQYFDWILNEFDAQDKTIFDIFSHQNTKLLVYRYNDYQESLGLPLMKIRHTLVTDNYLAAEEIQNQDWQYFIERVIDVCKFSDVTIRPDEEFLLSTIENVTVAKRVYTMIFKTVARSFNLAVSNLSYGKMKDISDNFSIKNYSYRSSLANLNDWISYYYLYGKFSGLEEFINVPFVNKLGFLKTETNLSPADLYSKFSATTAKGLVSLHALCALNNYFGGRKTVPQFAYGEFMKNVTYQTLSQENDDIFLSFDFATDLAPSTVNALADIENEEGKMASEISDQISDKLDIEFETVDSPAIQIQLWEEPEISQEPMQASTPLTEKDIREIHDKEKTDYLKTAIKLKIVDLESAAEIADSENEKHFQEIINPTPGLTLNDEIDVDKQFSFRNNSDLDYSLPNPLKSRLGNILHVAREKVNSVNFSPKVIEKIPNNTYPGSEITTDDFYIDDSSPDLQNLIYFPQPSTNDRKDFSINIPENEMILLKSPSLTLARVNKKELQNILIKIIADLDLNLTGTLMSTRDEKETRQKIVILQKLKKDLEVTPKENIEKQLESHGWLQELIEDQLKPNENSFEFGQDYENKNHKNKL